MSHQEARSPDLGVEEWLFVSNLQRLAEEARPEAEEWWQGGKVARRQGGKGARRQGGQEARWQGGQEARWQGDKVARRRPASQFGLEIGHDWRGEGQTELLEVGVARLRLVQYCTSPVGECTVVRGLRPYVKTPLPAPCFFLRNTPLSSELSVFMFTLGLVIR